jgi:hypothetical protein
MPLRKSKVEHEYPLGVMRKVGEKFDVEQQHVEILLKLGRIEDEKIEADIELPAVQAVQPENYPTRDMSARKKRPYHRKAA